MNSLQTVPPPGPAAAGSFLADVLHGLRRRHKELPCKYFYDEAGSALFERITELDEYYPTRTELAIMRRHAAAMARLLGPRCLLIEYGSGTSQKTRLLLDHLKAPAGYVPIDISAETLRASARALAAAYADLPVRPLAVDFTRPVSLPVAEELPGRRIVYFPGSTIGNFTPPAAVRLLRQTARLCAPGGALLIGADLTKEPAVLHAAYNDRLGVTAAFNRNILVRINRELGADFPVEHFWHHAYYNPRKGRVEMHLVSRCDECVHVAGEEVRIAEGESIHTENSYKYTPGGLRRMAAESGFDVRAEWTDERRWFSVQLWTIR